MTSSMIFPRHWNRPKRPPLAKHADNYNKAIVASFVFCLFVSVAGPRGPFLGLHMGRLINQNGGRERARRREGRNGKECGWEEG